MNAILSLLSFQAFRPDPLDVEIPLAERFKRRKTILFNRSPRSLLVVLASRNNWRACIAEFDELGAPTFGPVSVSPAVANRDGLTSWAKDLAMNAGVTHVALGLENAWEIKADPEIARTPPQTTMRSLRENPAELLGDAVEPDQTHCLVHHPLVESSCLHFRCRSVENSTATEVLGAAGLKIARMACVQAQMVEMAFGAGGLVANDTRSLLIGLPSSYLFIPKAGCGWNQIYFDPLMDENGTTTLHQQIVSSIEPDSTILYFDGGLPGISDLLHVLSPFNPTPLFKTDVSPAFKAVLNH